MQLSREFKMGTEEKAFVFKSGDASLLAVLHQPSVAAQRGVLMIVGGPQYRVGSHRQFVLLARYLAKRGIPVFRFDHAGIGDSTGEYQGFENIGDDIRAAINCFIKSCDGVEDIVIWGLCDAASAAMMYAPGDDRISGLIMLNPWARTESGQAQSIMRHYYWKRILSRSFWLDIFSGKFKAKKAFLSFFGNLKKAGAGRITRAEPAHDKRFTQRMLISMERFKKPAKFIISGKDLTAAEFIDLTKSSRRWNEIFSRPAVEVKTIDAASHTFATEEWRGQVENWTEQWVRMK